jgi:hypothetical protein
MPGLGLNQRSIFGKPWSETQGLALVFIAEAPLRADQAVQKPSAIAAFLCENGASERPARHQASGR